MNHRLLLSALAAGLAIGGGCFSGTDDVPQMSGSGGNGAGGGESGGSAANGGSSPSSGGSNASSSGGSTGTAGGGTGGGKNDPCANTFFCDDFESYTAGSPPGGMWHANQSGGSLQIDTGKHASGSKAVKVVANQASGYRSIMIGLNDASLFPVDGNKYFGRMMFFLESSPTGNVHWTFIDSSGKVMPDGYHAIYRYGGQTPITKNGSFYGNGLMANYDTPDSYGDPPSGPSTDCWLHGTDDEIVPVGKWSCAEWEFDGPNNTMKFWLDGKALPELTMDQHGQGCVNQSNNDYIWKAPEFAEVDLGWESYQADDARTFWIDDVALGKEKLGCPQ